MNPEPNALIPMLQTKIINVDRNSFGIVIPQTVIKPLNLKLGQEIIVTIKTVEGVKEGGSRWRVRRMYNKKPCEFCGDLKTDIHHKDGNALNNSSKNIQFLCRYHHMIVDNRMFKRNNGRFA